MKLTEALAQQLYQQMHLYHQQLTELHETLQRERDAVRQRDFDRFQQILEHKDHLLNEVSNFDQKIHLLLKKVLKKPSRAAFDGLIENYKGQNSTTLRIQWQGVKRLVEECQKANEINSKIVAQMQHYYDRLSAVLRRQDPNSSTYAKNGRQTHAPGNGGRLAQA